MKLNSKSINYNVQTVDELVSLDGLEGDTVVVTDEDRGGVFVYREDNVGTNNGGTVFNGWTRQYDGAVNVKWFGAKGDGITDDTSAMQSAIDTNKNVYIPESIYLVGGSLYHSVNYQHIYGDGIGRTILIVPIGRRGQTFKAVDKTGIRLSDMTIDTDNGDTEGGLIWSGVIDGLIERVEFLNGDLTSMLIAGNSHLLPSTQNGNNNTVRDCIARGQKRYTPGGTSPFIAGDYAYNTTFENCYVEDCAADAYDSDASYNTKFINCKAVATSSTMNYYGFWSEGETYDTEVTFDNCYVKNYLGGIGVSEKVKATIMNCKFENINSSTISRAIWSRHNKTAISNCIFINCNSGAVYNSAVVMLEEGGVVENCRFEDCNGRNAILTYRGLTLSNNIVTVNDCYFYNAALSLGYTNTGARFININNCTFEDAYISSYDTALKYVKTEKCVFNQTSDLSCISTARIARHLVKDCFFNFVGTTSTKPAISCTIDNYNTTVEDCYFDSFNSNVSNATFKKGNVVLTGIAQLNYEPENILLQAEVDIVAGGTFYAIPNLGPAVAGLLIVAGENYDIATSVVSFSDKSLGYVDGNYNILSQSSDYGTANYWQFDYTAPNGIRITHPTTGRKAKIIILKLIAGFETNQSF